jgi:hypothetical protein
MEVVIVTPEMAGDWLDHRNHPKNRKLSMSVAARYAADMKEGRWKLTPEGLFFDTDGLIISAQHRLQAVRDAAMDVPFWIFPDQPRDIFEVVDQGFKRTAAHNLQVPNASAVAAGARYLATLDDPLKRFARFTKVTNPEIVSAVRAWPELTWHSTEVLSVRNKAFIPPGPHLAVLAQAARNGHNALIAPWTEGLLTGINLTDGDPRAKLRDRFISGRRALSGSAQRDHVYSLIVKAWNAWAAEEKVSMLRWLASEPVPDVLSAAEAQAA